MCKGGGNGGMGGNIRNWILVCFHRFFSDKMTALKYVFVVFSKKITVLWCMFIFYTSINGLIQGMASIIESSFFILNITIDSLFFVWNEFTLRSIDSKVPLWSDLRSTHKIFKKFLKNILIKDEFIFEKYNFKIIQRCISACGSNTRCTCRKLRSVRDTASLLYNRMRRIGNMDRRDWKISWKKKQKKKSNSKNRQRSRKKRKRLRSNSKDQQQSKNNNRMMMTSDMTRLQK